MWNFFIFFSPTVQVSEHRLPREIVDTSFSDIFKSSLDMVLGDQLQVALLEQVGWTARGPFPPQPFCGNYQCVLGFSLVQLCSANSVRFRVWGKSHLQTQHSFPVLHGSRVDRITAHLCGWVTCNLLYSRGANVGICFWRIAGVSDRG